MKAVFRAAPLFLLVYFFLGQAAANALQPEGNRIIKLTLIPDYVNGSIRFDGQLNMGDPAKSLDWQGLPLIVEHRWKAENSPVWTVTGRIRAGKLKHDSESAPYRLVLGPVHLQPGDRLSLVVPFVNLDYRQITPPPDIPDLLDEISRQRTHLFTYAAGEAELDIRQLTVSFTPVVMKAELRLVPLVGEALAGKASGLRLSGNVRFENIQNFEVFSRYCQITPERLQNGDTRAAHLQYNLDFPAYFDPDVLDPVYRTKPTRLSLRTELTSCRYDEEKHVGEVQATFSGRILDIFQGPRAFPSGQLGRDSADGNYSFSPSPSSNAVPGYRVELGKILLAPGDVLAITVPNVQVQSGHLQPVPRAYENTGDLRIVYTGPRSFELVLPYLPGSNLYASQFPSFVRPGIALLEDQLGGFYPLDRSRWTWALLGLGFLLLGLSRFIRPVSWLSTGAWLLVIVSCYYGVRGSFGLLSAAVLLYIARTTKPGVSSRNTSNLAQSLFQGVACFALIALAVYLDSKGTSYFSDLSGPELSPLTPAILMLLAGALFLILYGKRRAWLSFARSDLPVLVLFLTVLSLYDAFDKSLLALLIFFVGGLIVLQHASEESSPGHQHAARSGIGLRRRGKLVFGNRIVPLAMLILLLFAIFHDLSSTFANEMQVQLPPPVAPLVIPALVFGSVLLTFASIAGLFVMVYPFLPLKTGYLKAAAFSLGLFLIFLFGIGTDDRLIASLPTILVGRAIYYLSVPMVIGLYLDIYEFMQRENKQRSGEGPETQEMDFQTASGMYFKNLRGMIGTLVSILSLVAPPVYAFLSSQPVIVTYFDLLEKLVLLPG